MQKPGAFMLKSPGVRFKINLRILTYVEIDHFLKNLQQNMSKLLHYAPLIAIIGWIVFCGTFVFALFYVPGQILAQLPSPVTSRTIPATTTPKPSRTANPIVSITPTKKFRATNTPDLSTALVTETSPTPWETTPALTTTQTQSSTITPATITPTATSNLATPASGIRLLSLTSPVSPGDMASLSIQVVPGTICQISFTTPLGNTLVIEGLTATRANTDGLCTWTWLIPLTLEAGEAKVTVNAFGVTQIFPLQITVDGQSYP